MTELSKFPCLSFEQLATFERAQGTTVAVVNDCYWYSARPSFYQALFPVLPRVGRMVPPRLAIIGGYKYCVPPNGGANGSMAFLMFRKDYSSSELDRKRRHQLRIAAGKFEVRLIRSAEEFARGGHPLYLDFLRRTGYRVFRARQRREVFERWARCLFEIPHLQLVGAYRGSELHAVSIFFALEGILSYATFFSSTESQACFVSDLMLHHFRETACRHEGITNALASVAHNDRSSVDKFYLLRGARLIVQPARVHINPVLNAFLKHFSPRHHRSLWGPSVTFKSTEVVAGVKDASEQPG